MSTTPEPPDDTLEDLRRALTREGVTSQDIARVLEERSEVDAMLTSITSVVPSAARKRNQSHRRRVWRVVGAAGLAVAVAVVLIFVRIGGTGPDAAVAGTPPLLRFDGVQPGQLPSGGEAAQTKLRLLADRAAAQPIRGNGDVQHIETVGWASSADESAGGNAKPSVLLPKIVERFYYPDGRMRLIEHTGAPLDQEGRLSGSKGNWSDNAPVSDETVDASDPGPTFPDTLPTDSAGKLIETLVGSPDPCPGYSGGCLISAAKQLHETYVLSSQLQSALWKAMATETSITYLGQAQDRLGRQAMVFTALDYHGDYQSLVFADPKTGAWLGSESVLVKHLDDISFQPPAVLEFTAVVTSRRQEAAGRADPADSRPNE